MEHPGFFKGRTGGAWKTIKEIIVYFLIFFFTIWVQMIAIALLFPWRGGKFHVLYQLDDIDEMIHFIARIYGSYLLVGLCASFMISFLKRNSNLFAIGIISSIAPFMQWRNIWRFVPEESLKPYLIFLAPTNPLMIVAATILGRKARVQFHNGGLVRFSGRRG